MSIPSLIIIITIMRGSRVIWSIRPSIMITHDWDAGLDNQIAHRDSAERRSIGVCCLTLLTNLLIPLIAFLVSAMYR